jgi:hypothetical protein
MFMTYLHARAYGHTFNYLLLPAIIQKSDSLQMLHVRNVLQIVGLYIKCIFKGYVCSENYYDTKRHESTPSGVREVPTPKVRTDAKLVLLVLGN